MQLTDKGRAHWSSLTCCSGGARVSVTPSKTKVLPSVCFTDASVLASTASPPLPGSYVRKHKIDKESREAHGAAE